MYTSNNIYILSSKSLSYLSKQQNIITLLFTKVELIIVIKEVKKHNRLFNF